MKKIIKIPTELRDYIERLNYEEFRYNNLLLLVDQNSMKKEEWEDSLEYFSILYEKAKISKNIALQEIYSIYKDIIQNELWCIDFQNSSLLIGTNDIDKIINDKIEPFKDFILRLYPNEQYEKIHINDSNVKDVTLQVTQSCNMNCSYCYQHNKQNHSMNFETAKKIIDMLLDADYKTNTYITSTYAKGICLEFIGGEPWLEIELITQISQYFINEVFRRKHPWAIKFMFGICSNGLLHFDSKVQDYLKKYKGLISYNISIDGDKNLHDTCRLDCTGQGTYDRAISAVYDYREKGNIIGSKMTISPENVNQIFNALKSMINNNYKNIHLNCVYEEGWTNEHATILYWQLHEIVDWIFDNKLENDINLSIFSEYCGTPKDTESQENWCGGLGLMLAFDYKGDAYPCLRYMETSSNKNFEPFIIGNINEGINQNLEHKNKIKCLSCITRQSQSTDECFNCPIASGCGWCSAYNYEKFGTPNKRTTYHCCMHKARSLINFYYQRRMNRQFLLHCPKEWAVEIIGETEFENLKRMEV